MPLRAEPAAQWSYALVVLCALRRFSPDRADGFLEFVEGLQYRYRTVSAQDVADLSRNDPCPCQSGRKLKHCHEGHLAAKAHGLP